MKPLRIAAAAGSLAVCSLAALSHFTVAIADPNQDQVFTRAPYVQLATPHSIHVVWRTNKPIDAVVRFGEAPDRLDRAVSGEAIVERRPAKESEIESGPPLHSAPEGTRQFEAALTGLDPATRYYYGIFDGETRLTPADPSYRFQTHPAFGAKDKPLYFWVVGDSGTGDARQAAVHQAMVDYNRERNRELDLYIHVGDMAYGSGTEKEFSERFFDMYEPTLRNTVVWAAMGNHEGKTSRGESGEGPYYDAYLCPIAAEAGGVASGKEAYYSFDFGNVHFIVLDSFDLDRHPSGAMAQWLRTDLEKTKADWLIAYWHHPPYTKGSHDSDKESNLVEMREHIMPILEAGGVDAVFTGHSHIYERSMLMDGAYATPTVAEGVILDDGDGDPEGDGPYRKSAGLHPNEGTIQVVAGHGGAKVSRKGTMPVMKRIIVENGSVLVSVEGNRMTGVMVNHAGEHRDTFALVKEGVVNPVRLDKPWQPERLSEDERNAIAAKAAAVSSTARLPKDRVDLIAQNSTWRYLPGKKDPPGDWARPEFDDSAWAAGEVWIGYGDGDDRTELKDMEDNYTVVYLRHAFEVKSDADVENLGLAVRYDDGFIAYLNGNEVLRVGVEKGRGSSASGVKSHNAEDDFEYFPILHPDDLIRLGTNILAIEVHNTSKGSSDLTMDPFLIRGK